MATSKEYLAYILEQLSGLEGVGHRAMMGEYVLYYREKVVGGLYDNRLLVKPVQAAIDCLPGARYELPYAGAKEMLLVGETDDRALLARLFEAMYPQLPPPKPKRRKAKDPK